MRLQSKKLIAVLCALAMIISVFPVQADAAAKPKFVKNYTVLYENSTGKGVYKYTVTNLTKGQRVKWSLSGTGKSYAKLKKTTTSVSGKTSANRALLSIRQGQIKAAQALGMTTFQTVFWIVIPQAARRALPGCGNEIIYLIKYSSLAMLVTCNELMSEAKVLASDTFRNTEVFLAVGLYYLILVSLATWCLRWLEKRYSIPGFGNR